MARTRHAAIDVTMGTYTSAAARVKEADVETTVEQIRAVIDEVKKCVVPQQPTVLGASTFVNAK